MNAVMMQCALSAHIPVYALFVQEVHMCKAPGLTGVPVSVQPDLCNITVWEDLLHLTVGGIKIQVANIGHMVACHLNIPKLMQP